MLRWAERFAERTWAVENATGLGYLLAQQLVAAGERVLEVQPKLAARVRLLASESTNKNDPHDALSVAIAALRSPKPKLVGGSLANVEFQVGDVGQFEDRLLDLVFARLLLCHVSAPMDIVRSAVAALRPGGVLLVEEPEFSACFSWPRHEGYDRCMALQAQVIRARGGDPDLGPKLASMLLDAGLRDVELCVFQPAFRSGPCKDIPQLSLERMAEAITGEALASGEEIQALIEDVGALAANPQSVLSYPRFFQVWGRL